MTTSHLKTGVKPTPETLCISNIPQTMDNVQHNVPIMNQSSSKTFYIITKTQASTNHKVQLSGGVANGAKE
jgi:hypothetical protein